MSVYAGVFMFFRLTAVGAASAALLSNFVFAAGPAAAQTGVQAMISAADAKWDYVQQRSRDCSEWQGAPKADWYAASPLIEETMRSYLAAAYAEDDKATKALFVSRPKAGWMGPGGVRYSPGKSRDPYLKEGLILTRTEFTILWDGKSGRGLWVAAPVEGLPERRYVVDFVRSFGVWKIVQMKVSEAAEPGIEPLRYCRTGPFARLW